MIFNKKPAVSNVQVPANPGPPKTAAQHFLEAFAALSFGKKRPFGAVNGPRRSCCSGRRK